MYSTYAEEGGLLRCGIQRETWGKRTIRQSNYLELHLPNYLVEIRSARTQFFTQEYEGRDTDISLIPWQNHRSLTSAMLNLIHNPTVEEFTEWMKAAERETWRCVDAVSNVYSKLINRDSSMLICVSIQFIGTFLGLKATVLKREH